MPQELCDDGCQMLRNEGLVLDVAVVSAALEDLILDEKLFTRALLMLWRI